MAGNSPPPMLGIAAQRGVSLESQGRKTARGGLPGNAAGCRVLHAPEGPGAEMAVRAAGAAPGRSPTFQNLQNQEAEPISRNVSPVPSTDKTEL